MRRARARARVVLPIIMQSQIRLNLHSAVRSWQLGPTVPFDYRNCLRALRARACAGRLCKKFPPIHDPPRRLVACNSRDDGRMLRRDKYRCSPDRFYVRYSCDFTAIRGNNNARPSRYRITRDRSRCSFGIMTKIPSRFRRRYARATRVARISESQLYICRLRKIRGSIDGA